MCRSQFLQTETIFFIDREKLAISGLGLTIDEGFLTESEAIDDNYKNYNQITSSVGFAADISASSEGGFEYDGLISGSSTSTASFAYVKVNDFTVNLADNPQFTTMSQKETFVVPNHTSKSYASARTAPTASDLISTSSYTDVLSGNIWINNSDGSLNFAYISGSQTSQSGYLFSKKIVGYETH